MTQEEDVTSGEKKEPVLVKMPNGLLMNARLGDFLPTGAILIFALTTWVSLERSTTETKSRVASIESGIATYRPQFIEALQRVSAQDAKIEILAHNAELNTAGQAKLLELIQSTREDISAIKARLTPGVPTIADGVQTYPKSKSKNP